MRSQKTLLLASLLAIFTIGTAQAQQFFPKNQPEQSVSIRTNLLHDAFLVPSLGVEWRIAPQWSVKLDGSISHWGDEHGKVQKIALFNPEGRWHLPSVPGMYVGASVNFGLYNIYKGMVGGLFSGDTGYQGNLYGIGSTVGYQLRLGAGFSLDFNLGLGYTHLRHDTFEMIENTRYYKERDVTKNAFGLTQAGISLSWAIWGK